jgi:hypothetical protein
MNEYSQFSFVITETRQNKLDIESVTYEYITFSTGTVDNSVTYLLLSISRGGRAQWGFEL